MKWVTFFDSRPRANLKNNKMLNHDQPFPFYLICRKTENASIYRGLHQPQESNAENASLFGYSFSSEELLAPLIPKCPYFDTPIIGRGD